MNTWVSRFGVPSIITTDRGHQFESLLWQQLMQLLGSKQIRITAYHPIANSLVERFHHQLKGVLKASPDPTNWVDMLPMVLLGIPTSLKQDLKSSTAELFYRTTLCLPGDFFQVVTCNSILPLTLPDYEKLCNSCHLQKLDNNPPSNLISVQTLRLVLTYFSAMMLSRSPCNHHMMACTKSLRDVSLLASFSLSLEIIAPPPPRRVFHWRSAPWPHICGHFRRLNWDHIKDGSVDDATAFVTSSLTNAQNRYVPSSIPNLHCPTVWWNKHCQRTYLTKL